MFEWLWDNKHWLFSGVGGMLIFWVGSWIKKKFWGSKTPDLSLKGASLQDIINSPPPKREPDIIATSLSPRKIIDEINSAPLLQQQEISKRYEGIRVSWRGRLSYAQRLYPEEMIDDKNIRIIIKIDEEKKDSNRWEYTSVFFSINSKQYPGIGLLREGHEISVEGIIEGASSYINLKVEKLVFDIDNST